jgi:tetratricopeptide (TPR) repeat protein
MGGDATFSGTTYQARTIAFIYVHILAAMRLGWLNPADDTPVAVSGETDGPGDDARIEFATPASVAEFQAKHGLGGGDEFLEVLERIRDKTPSGVSIRVVLGVDRATTSRWIYTRLPKDIARLRSGRPNDVTRETRELMTELAGEGIGEDILKALSVVTLDVDALHEPEIKTAFQLLENVVLKEPSQASAAWAVLVEDAGDICARKERRTRGDLVDLLEKRNKINVRPPARDDSLHRDLDFAKQLVERRHFEAAIAHLREIEKRGAAISAAEPLVRYRLYSLRASALLQLGEAGDALTSARLALDFDANGIAALTIAVRAYIELDRLDDAQSLADRAVAAHGMDGRAWGLRALVESARGAVLSKPPVGVADSPGYLKSLLDAAISAGDSETVLRLTAALLKEGERDAIILFHRANVLIDNHARVASGMSDSERCGDVERLSTEIIEALEGTFNPLSVKAYVLRSAARRLVGREEEAALDLATAKELRSDDADALNHEARFRAEAGDFVGARDVLRHPAIDQVPELRALRARLAAIVGDADAAKRDLKFVVAEIGGARKKDRLRIVAADAALVLEDMPLAQQLIESVSPQGRTDVGFSRLVGRLAFAKGNLAEGEAGFRAAIASRPDLAPELLAELGSHLYSARQFLRAVAVFEELALADIPEEGLQPFAGALVSTGRLADIQNLLNWMADRGPLPAWGLALAADVAMRQEDTETAIDRLQELVKRGGSRADARIELARLLIEIGRIADAKPVVEALLLEPGQVPRRRMQMAQLLNLMGRTDEALPIAHAAYLDSPSDPGINRAFIGMVFMGGSEPPIASAVGPLTYVRLTDRDDASREYIVLDRADVDPRRHEISFSDATSIGLCGKSVGDQVELTTGGNRSLWTVREIVPTLVRDAQQAAFDYETNFPTEPFFIAGFQVGNLSTVGELAPIISALEARKRRAEKIEELYRDNGFPLGMIAKLLGASIAEIMGHIELNERLGPLFVEWPDARRYAAAVAAARSAKKLVLTESALKTAFELGIADVLRTQYELIAPRSLLEDLLKQLDEAKGMVAKGHTSLVRDGDTIRSIQRPPNDPALVRRESEVTQYINFLRSYVRLEPRPIAVIVSGDSDPGSMRDILGRSSYDAAALARHLMVPLLTDDLGLRRAELPGHISPSFSTIAAVDGLAESGAFSGLLRDRYLIALAAKRYAYVRPASDLIVTAIRRATEIGITAERRVFSTLTNPGLELADAARITTLVVRAERLTASLQVTGTAEIVMMALDAMSDRWPNAACTQALIGAAALEFAMAPSVSAEVIRAARDWLQLRTP